MKQVLYINAKREGYAPDQVRHTMTIAELIGYLDQFDDDTPVYLKHDGGYTYGGIGWDDFEDGELCDEGEDSEEE